MATALAKRDPEAKVRELLSLLDDSVTQRIRLTKSKDRQIDLVMQALRDDAKGLWVEKEETFANGKTYKRVYQRAPNTRAAKLYMELSNLHPPDIANTLLALSRAHRMIVETSSGLPAQIAQLTAAQTKLFEGQASVFTKALAEKSEIPPLVQSISATAIGFLQHIGREGLEKAGSSEEAFQSLLERFVRAMDNALAKALEAAGADVEAEEEGEGE